MPDAVPDEGPDRGPDGCPNSQMAHAAGTRPLSPMVPLLPTLPPAPANGSLVYLIGPSGAGKDTLIARTANMPALALDERPLRVARRRITRPLVAGVRGGENHHPLSENAFTAALERGELVMHWRSHGLRYGIGREIDAWLEEGAVVIVNGSRAYLPKAQERYPSLIPVLLRVRPDVLRRRLLERGRETPEAVEARLIRAELGAELGAGPGLPELPNLISIDNSGPLERATAEFLALLRGLRRA